MLAHTHSLTELAEPSLPPPHLWHRPSLPARGGQADGLLITNDQLKDHVVAMLRPKHLMKWRERHIARYFITVLQPDAL